MDRSRRLYFLTFAVAGLTVAGTAAYGADEIKDSACMECHSDETLYKTNAAGKGISMFVNLEKLRASVHKTNTCVRCHADITSKHPDDEVAGQAPDCAKCHPGQSESYGASVHGLALANGRQDSATCVDCHDGHTSLPPTSIDSPLHFRVWRRRAAVATMRRRGMWKKAFMAKRSRPGTGRRRPAPIVIPFCLFFRGCINNVFTSKTEA